MILDRDEIGRRLVHALGLAYPISYVLVGNKLLTVGFIAVSLLVATILEYLRLNRGYQNIIFKKLTRNYESEKVAGYYLYIVGLLFAWIFYEWQIAIVASVMLGIVDPMGGVLNDDSRNKPTKVVIIVFLVSLIISLTLFNLLDMTIQLSIVMSVACAISTTVADCRKFRYSGKIVDDNLIIPIASGFLMTVAKYSYLIIL